MKISPDSYSNYLNPGREVLKTQTHLGTGRKAGPPPTYKEAVFVEDNFAWS